MNVLFTHSATLYKHYKYKSSYFSILALDQNSIYGRNNFLKCSLQFSVLEILILYCIMYITLSKQFLVRIISLPCLRYKS